MRDVSLFVARINVRISRKLKLEAALHGIPLDGVEGVEGDGDAPAPLPPEKKKAMAEALKAAQERVKQGWAKTN